MAKRVQQTIVAPKYKCLDCRRSYDWHEKKIGRGNYFCVVVAITTTASI